MAKKLLCPICEKHCPIFEQDHYKNITFITFFCERINRLIWIDQQLLKLDVSVAQLYYTIIVDDLLSRRYKDGRRLYYSLQSINSEENTFNIFINPATLPFWSNDHLEKMDHALMNIYRMFDEKKFRLDSLTGMRTILCFDEESRVSMENSLLDFDYIVPADSPGEPGDYIISREGWHRIKELREKETDMTCFIAISFDKKTSRIRRTLCEIIRETGFEPVLINEVEHNNQIVPEIEKRIQRCRFMIMDCTVPNNGAYYEAGMATGLGKELIICCREKEFHDNSLRPHFDVRQRSMIIWKNQKELREKLTSRIVCTVEGARDPTKSQPRLQ